MTAATTTAAVCSSASLEAGEEPVGTAPDAVGWVCLEQNGPWGPKAWTDSHLDPALGSAIEGVAAAHGVRPCLIRRPGRHADSAGAIPSARTVLVAHTRPGNSWLMAGAVSNPTEVLGLDWAAVAAGDLDAVVASLGSLVPSQRPLLLVCTNGTRDTCCARLGRPVAINADAAYPGRVWEVTHTSGHRFAPTTVLLPSGTLHARVLDGARLLDAADRGELVLDGYRGRSTWSPGAQVAEEHVRRTEGILGIDDLDVLPDVDAWSVRHRDGRRWWVTVTGTESGERPESCGKESKPVKRYSARTLG